ncbi:glycosyl transferase family 2, partial [Candidatus Roizmanbacteria bacterium CG03_land_8_20_14_0_80_39_12]
VSYNTKDLTLQCITKIQCALSKGTLNAEIIIVDNNSHDGSSEALKQYAQSHLNVKVIFNSANAGFGKPNNQGLTQADGRYVLYLNSDVFVPEEPFLDALVKQMDENPLQGALTARVNLASEAI